ncbi:MAG: RNA polymerase sigma factor [Coprobacillaceae bacterium]
MMKNIIDNTIIEAFKEGDEKAFNTIYKSYYRKIFFFVHDHCYNEELTKDIVQNTFIAAYKGKHTLKHNEAFHSWILKIAYNEMCKTLRNESTKTKGTDNTSNMDSLVDDRQKSIDKTIKEDEALSIVYHSIQTMKEEFKEVAMLRYYHELNNEEVSSILELPIGTIKSRFFRANKIIKKDLKQSGIETLNNLSALPVLLQILTKDIRIPKMNIEVFKMTNKIRMPGLRKILRKQTSKVVLSTTTVIIIVSLLLQVPKDKVEAKHIMDTESTTLDVPCRIKQINYDTNYTGHNIMLEIEVTNDNYDKINVNGIETIDIDNNGDYVVHLIKDDVIIDEKYIFINNIDKESPTIINMYNNNDTYYIQMGDSQSGININSLIYYRNGIVSNGYTYDERTNTIILETTTLASNVFYIEDNVGNWCNITVNVEEE